MAVYAALVCDCVYSVESETGHWRREQAEVVVQRSEEHCFLMLSVAQQPFLGFSHRCACTFLLTYISVALSPPLSLPPSLSQHKNTSSSQVSTLCLSEASEQRMFMSFSPGVQVSSHISVYVHAMCVCGRNCVNSLT